MKRIVLSVALLALPLLLCAVPAKPGYHSYVQSDGSAIMVRLCGDESVHWLEDATGKVLTPDADGNLVAAPLSTASARKNAMAARRAAQVPPGSVSSKLTRGERHIPVFLVNFSDVKFTISSPNAAFDRLLNEPGYSRHGAAGSVKDFYEDNSGGAFRPVFDVYGPVNLTSPMKAYGGNDSSGYDQAPEQAVLDAAALLDGEVDFSKYDYDGDGCVDMILMYYAGYNEAEWGPEDSIWPHQWDVRYSGKNERHDGKYIGSYFCTSELRGYRGSVMCGPATTCHEFAHSLGLPDMYDTNYSVNGQAGATYDYDVMASGSYNNNGDTPPYFNAEELSMLGWTVDIREIPEDGTLELPAFSGGNKVAYKSSSSTKNEYFLYECRGYDKWDKGISLGTGLVVYHIDKSTSHSVRITDDYGSSRSYRASVLWSDWESTNAINANGSHPCGYIIPAGAQNYKAYTQPGVDYGSGSPSSGLNYSGDKYVFGTGIDKYTPVDWEGVKMNYSLQDISYSDGAVSFSVSTRSASAFSYIDNPGGGRYGAGSEFALSLVEGNDGEVKSVKWYLDDKAVSGESVTLASGPHTIRAEVSLSTGHFQAIELEVKAE